LCALLIYGDVRAENIVQHQAQHGWLVLSQPLAAVIFFICILAEANRAPFDNAECEQELVGGYHTEYSSMRFALFFLAEYSHMITSCALFTLLFLGGYHLPLGFVFGDHHWFSPAAVGFIAVLAKLLVFFGKAILLVCFQMVIRWTLPRMRFDQIMMMAWQAVIPISLALVVVTSVMVYFDLRSLVPLLLSNIATAAVILAIYPYLPHYFPNRRTQLYGSRFYPMPGERVLTGPTHAMAIEDRPYEGTVTVQ
jgi:NADH-quinone oxidoreductase subunit H